jgi:Glycosyltransferase sugar-binding region containing DXD motif
LTGDPGPRVAAILRLLRPAADEIVVAADSRADRDRLEEYTAAADRVLRVNFTQAERHIAWLHEQCSCEWIFRIDADEVPSLVLLKQLRDLTRERRAQQYWFPRRWLYPDPDHWLEETPWWPDYQNRFVRNDGTLRFRGLPHTGAELSLPAAYVEEPLYHLTCLLADVRARRSRAITYEVMSPGLEAPGGGSLNRRFYLPELFAQRKPVRVPAQDAAAITAVLAVGTAPRAPLTDIAVIPSAETDRYWAGRLVAADAYAAKLEPLEPEPRMRVGEARALHFRVTNQGSETWPWDIRAGPEIRCAYRWLDLDETVLEPEGLRTSFPCTVSPGESVVVPVVVEAPAAEGAFLLEVDLVHEQVRWFDSPCRVRVTVGEIETDRPLLKPSRPGNGHSLRRRPLLSRLSHRQTPAADEIPHVIHRVWLGRSPMPEELVRYGETWRRHHPGWKLRLWRDRHVRKLVPPEAAARARHYSELSDLARFEVIRRFGGIYVDTDVECLRSIEPLLEGERAVLGYEKPGRVGTAVLAATALHPLFEDASEEARNMVGLGANSADATGPYFMTLLVRDHPDVRILEPEVFYPYTWDELPRPNEEFPGAYTVHHWMGSGRQAPRGRVRQSCR